MIIWFKYFISATKSLNTEFYNCEIKYSIVWVFEKILSERTIIENVEACLINS